MLAIQLFLSLSCGSVLTGCMRLQPRKLCLNVATQAARCYRTRRACGDISCIFLLTYGLKCQSDLARGL